MRKLLPLLTLCLLVVGCESTVDKRKNACADASISDDKSELEKLFGVSPMGQNKFLTACAFYK